MHATPTTLTGLGFPEALRWREGTLWFSDMFRGRVVAWTPGTDPLVVVDAERGGPAIPGGLGWLPDGDLLVVDCDRRRVLRVALGGNGDPAIGVHADLSALLDQPANDMHVDPDGTAWVGGYGFEAGVDEPRPSRLVRISPDGDLEPWGPGLVFPNGCERARDGAIIVAETFADRVSRITTHGQRTTYSTFANGSGPDGLSLAPDGSLYVALAFAGVVVAVDAQSTPREVHAASPLAAALGGSAAGCYDCAVHPSGARLAVACASVDEDLAMRVDTGRVELVDIAPDPRRLRSEAGDVNSAGCRRSA